MRGSPLIRSFLVFIAVALIGVSLTWLGGGHSSPPPAPPKQRLPDSHNLATPFVLSLSAPAKSVLLESAGKSLELQPDQQIISGTLSIDDQYPTVFITVKWKSSNPGPHFAKLTLEPPSRPTLTRTFDAPGELSDVWELPALSDHD